MFPFEQIDSNRIPNNYYYSKCYDRGEAGNVAKKIEFYGTEEWVESGNINLFHQNNTMQETLLPRKQQLTPFSGFGSFDDLFYDSPFQFCQEEHTRLTKIHSEISDLIAPVEEKSCTASLASYGIQMSSEIELGLSDCEKVDVPSYDTTACTKVDHKLSTKDFLRMAGEKFIQSSSISFDALSVLSHPFSSSFYGLSEEETKDVELIQNLLASAEKVGEQQFDRASKLLNYCHEYSSIKGSPAQRLVYYFSEALRQRIEQQTGRRTLKDSGKMQSLAVKEALMDPSPSILAFYLKVPFSQVNLFTAMQAIIENVSEAKKIHIIDLEIRCGLHFPVLMEALAARSECPVEHLKITAIGTKSKHKIEETGKRLRSVAQSLNLSFSFNVVMVADVLDLNETLFELDAKETVAVYGAYILSTMLQRPAKLENLMKVIRKINPCVMVVSEVESNHNSPIFVNRFIEALFYYGAFFDSIEECMARDDPNRMMSESMNLSPSITNIVATEGEERTIRHVNSVVWKAFFGRFGMVETQLSRAALYQAGLLVDNFACASSCIVGMVGESLVVGWKGTPIFSTTALKFL